MRGCWGAAIDGLLGCALDDCAMLRRWHCREAETMRAGAAALSGSEPAILIFKNSRMREGSDNECDATAFVIHGVQRTAGGDGTQSG